MNKREFLKIFTNPKGGWKGPKKPPKTTLKNRLKHKTNNKMIDLNLNISINSLIKKQSLYKWIKKPYTTRCCLWDMFFIYTATGRLKING